MLRFQKGRKLVTDDDGNVYVTFLNFFFASVLGQPIPVVQSIADADPMWYSPASPPPSYPQPAAAVADTVSDGQSRSR